MAGPEVAISHLQRRKIEGRVLIPFIQTLREKLGENAMREVLDATIRKLAAGDGAAWAETYGRTTASLRTVAQELWAGGGAMDGKRAIFPCSQIGRPLWTGRRIHPH
jgi:hypothetical protein